MKKRAPKPSLPDRHLETLLRNWQYMSETLRALTAQASSLCVPASREFRFPTPPGATWTQVEIVVLSPREARITVVTECHCYTFADLGLADNRNKNRPRAEWRMLCTYAAHPEPDAYKKLPYRKHLKVEISRFRHWLQRFFGIPGDPLLPFKGAHWLPRFKIREE